MRMEISRFFSVLCRENGEKKRITQMIQYVFSFSPTTENKTSEEKEIFSLVNLNCHYQQYSIHLLIYFNHLQARIPINTEQVQKRKTKIDKRQPMRTKSKMKTKKKKINKYIYYSQANFPSNDERAIPNA